MSGPSTDITPAIPGKSVGGVAIPAAVGSAIGSFAAKAGNTGELEQTDQAQVKSGNANSFPEAKEATNMLKPALQNANQGLDTIAAAEQKNLSPTGEAVKGSGLDSSQDATTLRNETHAAYQEAVRKTGEATIAAESALKAAASSAAIDPQQYLNTMGTDKKVMTAIGMVLSGIGAGLTGQPNLAVDLYNKNTDRAIAAQKQKFEAMMAASAQSQGLLKTAQDRQAISATAYQMAVMSNATGNNTAIDGALLQTKGDSAQGAAAQLKLMNTQKFQDAHAAFARDYINTMNSGNALKVNQMNDMVNAVKEALKPGSSAKFTPATAAPSERASGIAPSVSQTNVAPSDGSDTFSGDEGFDDTTVSKEKPGFLDKVVDAGSYVKDKLTDPLSKRPEFDGSKEGFLKKFGGK